MKLTQDAEPQIQKTELMVPPWAKRVGSSSQWAQRTDHQATKDYSKVLKLNEFSLVCFGLTWDPLSLFFLPPVHFGIRMSVLCLSLFCNMEADNLFGGVTGP